MRNTRVTAGKTDRWETIRFSDLHQPFLNTKVNMLALELSSSV